MYIKKIIAATAVIGMIVGGIFAYTIYGKFFSPNTAFNNEEAHLYVKTDATYSDVRADLEPLIDDIESFDQVAERKGYVSNIKPGHFIIEKGSNNNEIVNMDVTCNRYVVGNYNVVAKNAVMGNMRVRHK